MSQNQTINETPIPFRYAVIPMLVMIIIMGICVIVLKASPHVPLLIGTATAAFIASRFGYTWNFIEEACYAGIKMALPAILIIIMIGLTIGSWIGGGIVATMVYYGLKLLSPSMFLFTICSICCIVTLAIGSSWATMGTIGVAAMGIGHSIDIPAPMVAGAVISGAYFGDKMSPISDTTGISASIVGIDLFEHIRNMMYTTVPAWLISAAVYLWLLPAVAPHDLNGVVGFRQQLEGSGLVHLYALLPFVLLLGMALMKIDAIVTLMATIFLALGLTYFHSTPSLAELGQWFFKGPSFPEAWGDIAKLLSRGGVESMFFTQTIVILGLSFGGLLFALGVIPTLLDGIRSFLTTTGRATFSVAATAVGVNTLIGEQYLSILLSGETFKPVYEKLHLHPRNLSRTLEDAGTVINPLVPWSVCGVFIFNVLGVPVWHYLPYAIFCYMSLVLTLVFGWTGVTLSRVEPKK